MKNTLTTPTRYTKEITYKTKLGNVRVSEVSLASAAGEILNIVALGGVIVKIETCTY